VGRCSVAADFFEVKRHQCLAGKIAYTCQDMNIKKLQSKHRKGIGKALSPTFKGID